MTKINNYQKEIAILTTSFFVTMYFISIIINFPMVGIEVSEKDNFYYVIDIDENAWAAKNGIKIGDIITKVNGENPEENKKINLFSRIEQINTINVIHEDKETMHRILYKKDDRQLIYHLIMPVIFFVFFFIINILLIITNGKVKDRSVSYLIQFLNMLGFSYISVIIYGRMDLLGIILKPVTFTYTFAVFISFMQAYLEKRDKNFVSGNILKLIYLFVIGSCSASILLKLYFYNTSFINSFSFITLLALTFFLLIRYYFQNQYSSEIFIVKSIIISGSISLIPFIFLFVIPNFFSGKELLSFEVSAIFFIFVPIYFLYMLFSKSLFDFNFILNRLQYYTFISLGISGALFCIELIVFENRKNSLLEVMQFNILAFIIIIISLYLKDYLEFKFRKVLYYHKKNYSNSLNRFLHQTKNECTITNLIGIIRRELQDVLNVTDIICISISNLDQSIKFLEKEKEFDFQTLQKIEWDTYDIGSLIHFENYFAIVIAVLPQNKIVIVGNKKSLNIDEIVWLETMANYVNLQFECSRKIEDLMNNLNSINSNRHYNEFTRLSFMIAEKERENLARDIHDGVLQDQLRLYRKIEIYESEMINKDFKEILEMIREQIMDHIYITRETCNNLRPPFIQELGLKKYY